MKSRKPSLDGYNLEHSESSSTNIRVEPIDKFTKEAERLMKKHRSLVDELRKLEDDLRQNPTMGTPIGHSCYKRLVPEPSYTGFFYGKVNVF